MSASEIENKSAATKTPNAAGANPTPETHESDIAAHELAAAPLSARPRAFTIRSLIFGLLGIYIVSAGAGFHYAVLDNSDVNMISNHMPAIVFAYLMALGLVWNGLIGRLWRGLLLSPAELAVIMIGMLVACFPAASGLMRYALPNLANPWHFWGAQPEWRAHGVLETILPGKLFPQPVPVRTPEGVMVTDPTVYQQFYTGMALSGKSVGFSAIPWSAWLQPLVYWGPLVGAMSLAVVALSFLVHRQWSTHEQLGYPVAQVASSFWQRSDNAPGVPDIFRNRLFWFGFVPLFLLYQLDLSSRWFPSSLPNLNTILPNLKQWYLPILGKHPVLYNTPAYGTIASQRISFMIVGLSYFVGSEIALTMGLSQFLLATCTLAFFWTTGAPVAADQMEMSRAGAYFGYTLILLYTGRTYFRAVFAKAFFLRSKHAADPVAIVAARVLVLAFATFAAVLTLMGCDWLMAIFYGLGLLMLFLAFTRVICETGVPFLQANWSSNNMLVSLLGTTAVGPRSLTLLAWTNSVIAQDPRESLMPYVATGIRMADDARLRLRRIFIWIVAGLAIALVIAFMSNLRMLYNQGSLADTTTGVNVPQQPFSAAVKWVSEVKDAGELDASVSASGFGRLALLKANAATARFFLVGALLVAVAAIVRFRYSRFPIHPVLFLVWGTGPVAGAWASYLLGWFIKTLVVRFGGGRAYQRLKPVFIGLIASELMAVAVVILVDFAYYWVTGHPSTVKTSLQLN